MKDGGATIGMNGSIHGNGKSHMGQKGIKMGVDKGDNDKNKDSGCCK